MNDDPGRPPQEGASPVPPEPPSAVSLGDLLFAPDAPEPPPPVERAEEPPRVARREEPPPVERAEEPAPVDAALKAVEEARPRALSRRRFRTLAAVAEAIVPPGGRVPWSATDVGVAERLDAVLSTLQPGARRMLERTLTVWEWMWIFSRGARPFSRLSPAAREAAVRRAGRGRLLRGRLLFILKHYCLNMWASTPQVEEGVGFTYSCVAAEPPREAPPLEVVSWPQVSRDHSDSCDVVVVGSGAGGAVVAKELAECGLSVVVLEEGGYYTRKDFTGPPWERVLRLYRAGATTVAYGNPSIPLPLGMAVGGSTLVNSGTCFRTPDGVLERWGRTWGIEGIDPESMRPFFERVERILQAKPAPEEVIGENARVFRRGVERLGVSGAPLTRNIEGCRGCGVCPFGCPSDAKQSTPVSYLPRAQRHGATIFARARVERILVEDGRARGVVASLTDPESGEPRASLTLRSKVVVVAAGTVHTPALLAGSALANRSGQLGRNLRIHPSTGLGGLFEQDVYPWRGTLQSFCVDEWRSEGIMIEVTSSVPSIAAGSAPGVGLEAKDFVAGMRRMATAGIFVSDTSSGRVIGRSGREPLVFYRLNRTDARGLVRGMARIAEILLAAGASEVLTGLPSMPSVASREDVERLAAGGFPRGTLKLTAFHPVGTARMGADPETCVVDPWGEVHGVPGLFVADGSVLPGCPTVNPMVSIMALATRTAEHLVREGGRYF